MARTINSFYIIFKGLLFAALYCPPPRAISRELRPRRSPPAPETNPRKLPVRPPSAALTHPRTEKAASLRDARVCLVRPSREDTTPPHALAMWTPLW